MNPDITHMHNSE